MPVKNSHIHQFFVNGLQGSIWNNKSFSPYCSHKLKKCTQYRPFGTKICTSICSWPSSSDARHPQFSERKVPGKHKATRNSSIWHTVMPNGGYCVYYPSNIFEICEKNIYEQLTVLCSVTTANCFLILNYFFGRL